MSITQTMAVFHRKARQSQNELQVLPVIMLLTQQAEAGVNRAPQNNAEAFKGTDYRARLESYDHQLLYCTVKKLHLGLPLMAIDAKKNTKRRQKVSTFKGSTQANPE